MDLNSKDYNEHERKILEIVERIGRGNGRYINGKMINYTDIEKQRSTCTDGQNPHTTVVLCSDSRVNAELIFDEGPSKIFAIETAGNVLDNIAMGSVEYGILHTHTPVLMIMGHTNCGAVTATYKTKGKTNEGHIKYIVDKINSAFENGYYEDDKKCIHDATIKNAENVANEVLEKSKEVSLEYKKGNIAVLVTMYKLDTGAVKLIKAMHPNKKLVEDIEVAFDNNKLGIGIETGTKDDKKKGKKDDDIYHYGGNYPGVYGKIGLYDNTHNRLYADHDNSAHRIPRPRLDKTRNNNEDNSRKTIKTK